MPEPDGEMDEITGELAARPARSTDPADSTLVHDLKVIMVGNSSTGKTNLIRRFRDGVYDPTAAATVAVDMCARVLTLPDSGTRVRAQLWDTAGQERFWALTSRYFRDAHVVVVVFDITNRDSFLRCQAWIDEARSKAPSAAVFMLLGTTLSLSLRYLSVCPETNKSPAVFMLLANKIDLAQSRVVADFEVVALSKKNKVSSSPQR
jgi:small GTP-binding protein